MASTSYTNTSTLCVLRQTSLHVNNLITPRLNMSITAVPRINRIISFSSVSLLSFIVSPIFKALNLSHYLVLMSHFIRMRLDGFRPHSASELHEQKKKLQACCCITSRPPLLIAARKTITAMQCPHIWTSIIF